MNSIPSKYCMPYHQYNPLPNGWIRLLQIHDVSLEQGGKGSDNTSTEEEVESDLIITLQNFPLSDCPQYVALSYTWGEPTEDVDPASVIFTAEQRCYPIYTDEGLILRGTRNLRAALRRVRQARAWHQRPIPDSSTRTIMNKEALDLCGRMEWFWVDALCIDQDNLVERADQVVRMRKIYQQSHACIAWLGEADVHSKIAEKLFWDISTRRVRVAPEDRQKAQDVWNEKLSDKDFWSLVVTFARNWFSRIWVLQEVLLAPQTVALWSRTSFILIPLLEIYRQIVMSRGSTALAMNNAYDIPSSTGTVVAKSVLTKSIIFGTMRAFLRCKHKLMEDNVIPNFYNVMEMAWQRLAADPRDCIYGVLGVTREFLSESGEPVINVDYTLPVETVYVEATAAIARYGRHLDFLIFVCNPEERNFKALPSWCPDYSVTRLLPDFNHKHPSLWTSEPDIHVLDGRLLEVDGIFFDAVDRTYRPDAEEEGLAVGVRKAVALLQLAASTKRPECVESLARMLLMDQVDIRGPASPAAAILLPLGLINIMKVPLPSETTDSDQYFAEQDSAALSEALEQLYEIVNLLGDRSPRNRPYLPHIELFQEAFEPILRTGQSKFFEVNFILEDVFMSELHAIDQRADDVGLLKELLELLGNGPRHSPLQNLTADLTRRVKLPPFLNTMLYRIDINLKETTFYLTQERVEFGFGYRVQEGDEIWMLHGSKSPVLLHRCSDTGHYEFKGQLYVSGLMRGEMCKERDSRLQQKQRVLIQ